MGLMMLGAAMGDTITISADGDGAEQAVERLCALVEASFGEEMTRAAPDHRLLQPAGQAGRAGFATRRTGAREGLFLAEGLRILTEAREAGGLPEILFFGDGARHPLLDALIAETEAAGGEAIETNADILHKLSGKDNPQTVLGVYRALRHRPRRRSTGAPRRSGSWRRRCAIPAISARSCGPATRSAPAG